MRIPRTPPDFETCLRNASQDPERLKRVLAVREADRSGRYFHWEDIRYREPPEGMSREDYWLGLRMARMIGRKPLPLLQIDGTSFSYNEPDVVRRGEMKIDAEAKGQIQMPTPVLSNPETQKAYLVKSLIEEAFNSSVIEGAATTRQAAKEIVRDERDPRSKDELMVLNNYRTMEFVKSLRDEPLSVGMIHEIQRLVTEGTLEKPEQAGRFRLPDENINVADQFGEILHDPPPAGDLPERIERLCEFANATDQDGPFLHPVVKAIVLHFMVGYDHPYADGNGRTARALFYWSMLRDDYWLMEYISISQVISESKVQYGQAYLRTETDDGDLTYFLVYNIGVILSALDRLKVYLEGKAAELKELEVLLKGTAYEKMFNARQLQLLEYAVQHPNAKLTIRQHQNLNKVSYHTARSDLELLAAKSLLEKKSGKQSVYVSPPDLIRRLR